MDKENIRSNDTAKVTMAFKDGPCYTELGTVFIFREGLTRGRGIITKMYSEAEEDYQQFFKKK
jgi:GTPase